MTKDSSNQPKSEAYWYNIAFLGACCTVILAYFVYKKTQRGASLGFFSSTFNRINFRAHDNDLDKARENYYSHFHNQQNERDEIYRLLLEQGSQGLQITANVKNFLLKHQGMTQHQEVDRSTDIETLLEQLMYLLRSYPLLPQGVQCTIQNYNDTGQARAEHHSQIIKCFALYYTLLEERLKEVEQIPLNNVNI